MFGINACLESIEFDVEVLHKDPLHMLGKYTLRAKQDPSFHKTMIDALMIYIERNGIRWND